MLNFFHRRQAGQKKRSSVEDSEDDCEGYNLKEIVSPRPLKRSKSSLENPLLRPSSQPPPQKSALPTASALINEVHRKSSSRAPSPASPAPSQLPWLPASYLSPSSSIVEREDGLQSRTPTPANPAHWAVPSDSRAFPLAPHTRSNLDDPFKKEAPANNPSLHQPLYSSDNVEPQKSFGVNAYLRHGDSYLTGGRRLTNNRGDRTSLREPKRKLELPNLDSLPQLKAADVSPSVVLHPADSFPDQAFYEMKRRQEMHHSTGDDPLGGFKAEVRERYLSVPRQNRPMVQRDFRTGSNVPSSTRKYSSRSQLSALAPIPSEGEERGSSTNNAVNVPDDQKIRELISRLNAIFENKDAYKKLLSCRGRPAQSLLDMLQRLLDVIKDPPHTFQRNLIAATQRLAGKCGLYPTCYELHDVTEPDASKAVVVGGFADIFKGTFRGRPVCLKTIRRNKQVEMERFMKVVSREAILWGQLRHPNLLPFYGIYRFKSTISLVSPWMENGNAIDFLAKNKDLSRVIMTFDVAKGLEFLHQHDVIHGDLKGANLLVNERGRICLGDFGLSSVSSKEIVAFTSVSTMASKGGTVRWQAPELFNHEGEEDPQNTKSSDIYAWACVAYEIFAGEVPFAQLSRETTIMYRVTGGQRPTRPLNESLSWRIWGLTETIWTLMENCWNADPTKRPTIDVVITQLETGLPHGQDRDADGAEHLSPGQFREMARSWSDGIELSVTAFERLFV